jgi:hypothetical protein
MHTHMHMQMRGCVCVCVKEEERTPQGCTFQFPKLISNNSTADTQSCEEQATLMPLISEYWKQW